jgi:hypothetical protein
MERLDRGNLHTLAGPRGETGLDDAVIDVVSV